MFDRTLAWRWIAYGLIRARGRRRAAHARRPFARRRFGLISCVRILHNPFVERSGADSCAEGFSQAGILSAYLRVTVDLPMGPFHLDEKLLRSLRSH